MAETPIRFEDGGAYEQSMGVWSRLAGADFLDWLTPDQGLRWVDVGCGSGAFTELIVQRHAPVEVQGLDPSEGQLTFARTRPGAKGAVFQTGDALALPFPDGHFDAAVMALVIFFVPDPARGVAEMARVVRPGGGVSAYAWDMAGGGFPFEPVYAELRLLGLMPPMPPSADAARPEVLRSLWEGAGLEAVEARTIPVRRTFQDFEDFWLKTTAMGAMRASLAAMTPEDAARFKDRVRVRLPADEQGRITYGARANAIKGRVRAGT